MSVPNSSSGSRAMERHGGRSFGPRRNATEGVPYGPSSLQAEAIEVFLPGTAFVLRGAEVQAVADRGGAGEGLVAQLILGDERELRRARLEDVGLAAFVRPVDVAAGVDRRGARLAGEALT